MKIQFFRVIWITKGAINMIFVFVPPNGKVKEALHLSSIEWHLKMCDTKAASESKLTVNLGIFSCFTPYHLNLRQFLCKRNHDKYIIQTWLINNPPF